MKLKKWDSSFEENGNPPDSFIRKLRNRRIIKTLAAFVGVGVAIVEFAHHILVNHYKFPPQTVDLCLVTLTAVLLCTLIWRWFGGKTILSNIKLEFSLIFLVILITVFFDVRIVLQITRANIDQNEKHKEESLRISTGLEEEELEKFMQVVEEFENENSVTIKVENVDWKIALSKLEERKFDLITFDIIGRHELVRRDLVNELDKRLIPSSVDPLLLKYLKVNDKIYFAPFRLNVQLIFFNKKRFAEIGINYCPKTWQDVKDVAKKCYEKQGEARVVIQATNDTIPLTMLQIIRSAGGDPRYLYDSKTKEVLEYIREIFPYISPKSKEINWQTACSFLLADSVFLARNWTFSLGVIHKAGRDADFEVHAGWSWDTESEPNNLLGGEFLALPKNARHKELALKFMKFLMSHEVQAKLVAELTWPPMRLDTAGILPEWLRKYIPTMKAAIANAEPTPEYWSMGISDIYRRLFHRLISLPTEDDIESILQEFQKEIDSQMSAASAQFVQYGLLMVAEER